MTADIIQFPGMANLPNRIREYRNARDMSQQQLADQIYVSKPTISELETGKMQLTVDYMRRIGKAFECAPSELLHIDDQLIVLTAAELQLVHQFRAADEIQKEMILRVAAPRSDAFVADRAPDFSAAKVHATRDAA